MAPPSNATVLQRSMRLVCNDRFKIVRLIKAALTAPLLASLAGCKMVVMSPAGDVAAQQRDLILLATGLMLLIIVPVIALTLFFAWKYRASNTAATYDPTWRHSTRLEMAIWGAPLAIILVLGSVTWATSHTLDPYRPLDRVAPNRPVPAGVKPLEVDVVALDWKWLFIYPELGVATVNELAAPVDRPIEFKITASSVMNSFYVPALAGQIYAMPGMQTQLHAVINKPGVYDGFSANYSGAGFSGMRFKFKGMAPADFDRWVADNRSAGAPLTRAGYLALERPSMDDPVRRYASVDPALFLDIVERCAEPGQVCKGQTMRRAAAASRALASATRVLCSTDRRSLPPRPVSQAPLQY
ncbi:MAG: ubiquinol oxidase subunit II [Caulobacteraceae bacterium]|nr:ubiquinol oxidase subunit II [Caulobacteraceae bacterium]